MQKANTRTYRWLDTADNHRYRERIIERAKRLAGKAVKPEDRERFSLVAGWYRETATEMLADFAEQKVNDD